MAVLISKYSHDQLASYISSVNRWVSSCVASCHLIGPHKEGDIPIMTLIPLSSSSCHLTTLAKFLKSSCSWFHHLKAVTAVPVILFSVLVISTLSSLSIFQFSISCALHYIWHYPTHQPVPRIVEQAQCQWYQFLSCSKTWILVAKDKFRLSRKNIDIKHPKTPIFPCLSLGPGNWDARVWGSLVT